MTAPDPRFQTVQDDLIEGLSPAKLNLFLEVTGRRPDGFHELESVFHEIDLADRIRVQTRPSGGADRLETLGLPLDCPPEQNLVLRAVQAFRRQVPGVSAVNVSLEKRIPSGGGLGGGSSNAAFVLCAMWRLARRDGDGTGQLAEMARDLGSDVPFFLTGGSAHCRGRGEIVTPLPTIPTSWFVLARPGFSLSTALVYGRLRLTGKQQDVISFIDRARSRHGEGDLGCFNRLESPAFALEPRLRDIRDRLVAATRRPWTMTGSGSVLFSVAPRREDAMRVASTAARLDDAEILVARTFERGPSRGSR